MGLGSFLLGSSETWRCNRINSPTSELSRFAQPPPSRPQPAPSDATNHCHSTFMANTEIILILIGLLKILLLFGVLCFGFLCWIIRKMPSKIASHIFLWMWRNSWWDECHTIVEYAYLVCLMDRLLQQWTSLRSIEPGAAQRENHT